MNTSKALLIITAVITHAITLVVLFIHAKDRIGNTPRQNRIFTILMSISVLGQVSNDFSAIFFPDLLPYTLSDLSYGLIMTGTFLWIWTETEFLRVLEPISGLSQSRIKLVLGIISVAFVNGMIPIFISLGVFFGVPVWLSQPEYDARYSPLMEEYRSYGLGIYSAAFLFWEIWFGGYVFYVVSLYSSTKKQDKSVTLYIKRFMNLSITITMLDIICASFSIYKALRPPNDDTANVLISMTAYILQFHLFLIAMIFNTIPKIVIPKAVERIKAEGNSLKKVVVSGTPSLKGNTSNCRVEY